MEVQVGKMRNKKAHQHHRYPKISENSPAYRNGQLVWTTLVALSLAAAALHQAANSSRPASALARGVPERVTNRSLSFTQSQAGTVGTSGRPSELPARRAPSYPH